jgi:hypothetical protein
MTPSVALRRRKAVLKRSVRGRCQTYITEIGLSVSVDSLSSNDTYPRQTTGIPLPSAIIQPRLSTMLLSTLCLILTAMVVVAAPVAEPESGETPGHIALEKRTGSKLGLRLLWLKCRLCPELQRQRRQFQVLSVRRDLLGQLERQHRLRLRSRLVYRYWPNHPVQRILQPGIQRFVPGHLRLDGPGVSQW